MNPNALWIRSSGPRRLGPPYRPIRAARMSTYGLSAPMPRGWRRHRHQVGGTLPSTTHRRVCAGKPSRTLLVSAGRPRRRSVREPVNRAAWSWRMGRWGHQLRRWGRRVLHAGALVVGLGGLWLLDVSDVVLSEGGEAVCNGLWCMDAKITFHLGLYGAVAGLVLLFLLAHRD